MSVHVAPVTSATVVVAVDVGKVSAALSVTGADRRRLLGPVDFAMTGSGLGEVLARVRAVLPCVHIVKVGIEALVIITGR